MNLSKSEFAVLSLLATASEPLSQRRQAKYAHLSLGTVSNMRRNLTESGLLGPDGKVTPAGYQALEPYKVDNAVILAAGLSSRFAPISYEKPKGLLQVRGEILIDRQIEQLRAAGIEQIAVVVGYKAEYFFYLEQKYGVTLIFNPDYAARENHASLLAAKELLGNTYICSSDNYFTENPFSKYAYKAYYAAQYREGPTDEYCMTTGTGGRIVKVTRGGEDDWAMLGHAYFDRAFSKHIVEVIEAEYDDPISKSKLWEDFYVDHIKEFDMVMKPYGSGVISEFDRLDDLCDFDPLFIVNVDSDAIVNIEKTLGCTREEIHDFYPLKQGLTNLSCHFATDEGEYVYRCPGVGTEELIDRHAEMLAQQTAHGLGLDDTFIHEDPDQGWKISRFIPNCSNLNAHDPAQLKEAMEMARRLHEAKVGFNRPFDFYDEGCRYRKLIEERGRVDIPGFYELCDQAEKVKRFALADNAPACLNHNDFFELNFLVDQGGKLYLIDWEYAGTGDYANDYGTFTVCSHLSPEEAERALSYYYGRTPTPEERRHNHAFVGLAGWCWYLWSVYKEQQGAFVGDWMHTYHTYAVSYLDKAQRAYEEGEKSDVEKR